MDLSLVPQEYQSPEDHRARTGRWLGAIVAIALVAAASLALVTASEIESPVAVPVSR